MKRRITGHEANEANRTIEIVADERGQGNASHLYHCAWDHSVGRMGQTIRFQEGPIKEAGLNGITNEVLLAIVADRLEGFQSGPYACADNARALECVVGALAELRHRTREREARGVEGTHEP